MEFIEKGILSGDELEEYLIENYDSDLDDLEEVASSLSEFDYYQNVNK